MVGRHTMTRPLAIGLLFLLAAAISVVQIGAQAPPAQQAASPSAPPPAAVPGASPGAAPEVTLEIRPGQESQLKLAAPSFKVRGVLSPAARQAATQLEEAVRNDLERTGIFVIQGPTELAAAKLTGDPAHDFEQYRALGNEVLLLGEVYEEGGRLALLVHLAEQQHLVAERPVLLEVVRLVAGELRRGELGRTLDDEDAGALEVVAHRIFELRQIGRAHV